MRCAQSGAMSGMRMLNLCNKGLGIALIWFQKGFFCGNRVFKNRGSAVEGRTQVTAAINKRIQHESPCCSAVMTAVAG